MGYPSGDTSVPYGSGSFGIFTTGGGTDAPVNIDPVTGRDYGSASTLTVLTDGNLDLKLATDAGVLTWSLTGLKAGDCFKNLGVITVLGTSTVTSVAVGWGPDAVMAPSSARGSTSGTVAANQGSPNAGGAQSWNVQGAQEVGTATAQRPVYVAGQDQSGNLRPLPLGPASLSNSIPTIAPTPAASAVLTNSATLPAAGAYEAVPVVGAMVAVPAGRRKATIGVLYTRGAVGGQAAHKVYLSDGTNVFQAMAPDGTYNGVSGAASTGAGAIGYAIDVDVTGGSTKIGITGAEIGVTGTPGSYSTTVTFD